jgi:hypothetical protein
MSSSAGFFSLPITFYHGRIPFIMSDLLQQLDSIDGASSPDLFDGKANPSNVTDLTHKLDHGRISDWSRFRDVSTLSAALLKFLDALTATEALISEEICQKLCADISSDRIVRSIRRHFAGIYEGRHRCLLVLSQFLGRVTKVPESRLFELFATHYFGEPVVAQLRSPLKRLFHVLIQSCDIIFRGAILGSAALLSDRQVEKLAERLGHSSEAGSARPGLSDMSTATMLASIDEFTGNDAPSAEGAPPAVDVDRDIPKIVGRPVSVVFQKPESAAMRRPTKVAIATQYDNPETAVQSVQCQPPSSPSKDTQTRRATLDISDPAQVVDVRARRDQKQAEAVKRKRTVDALKKAADSGRSKARELPPEPKKGADAEVPAGARNPQEGHPAPEPRKSKDIRPAPEPKNAKESDVSPEQKRRKEHCPDGEPKNAQGFDVSPEPRRRQRHGPPPEGRKPRLLSVYVKAPELVPLAKSSKDSQQEAKKPEGSELPARGKKRGEKECSEEAKHPQERASSVEAEKSEGNELSEEAKKPEEKESPEEVKHPEEKGLSAGGRKPEESKSPPVDVNEGTITMPHVDVGWDEDEIPSDAVPFPPEVDPLPPTDSEDEADAFPEVVQRGRAVTVVRPLKKK